MVSRNRTRLVFPRSRCDAACVRPQKPWSLHFNEDRSRCSVINGLCVERPPAEVINEHWFPEITEGISSADTPAVDSAAVRAYSQAHEMFEPRMIQHRER